MVIKTLCLTLVLLAMFFALAAVAPPVEAFECRYVWIDNVAHWVCS
jgi:hypothetical protein